MNDLGPDDRLNELCWRGPLSRAEQERIAEWLQAHPEFSADIQEELALTQSLKSLQNVPIPSNFTARVMAEIQRRPDLSNQRRAALSWWGTAKSRWMPRLAFAAVLAIVSFGSLVFVEQQHRAKIGQSVSVLSEVAASPGAEIWSDFEAIRVLHTPAADVELLTLLQ